MDVVPEKQNVDKVFANNKLLRSSPRMWCGSSSILLF